MRVRVKKSMPKPHVHEHAIENRAPEKLATESRSSTSDVSNHAQKNHDASSACVGTRKILWGNSTGEAQVYRWESLAPGNRIAGPAILEGLNTTYFVPHGWKMEVDRFGNAIVTRSATRL